MNIFSHLNSILFTKKPIEEFDDYVPYMIHRWTSMYSPEMAQIINQYINTKYIPIKEDI